MTTGSEAVLTAGRLSTNVSSQEDPEQRVAALAKFISGYEPEVIGPVLGIAVGDACSRIEFGLTFLSLINRDLLQSTLPDWDWRGLDNYFRKSKLDDTWRLFSRLSPEEAEYVTAKTSMLIEVMYILIEDDLLDPGSDMECTGADIALKVMGEAGSGEQNFRLSLSSYPMAIRKFMKDILTELDFIEKSPGIWNFFISPASLKKYSAGGNLAAHMGTGQMSQAMAQRNAENLVKRLELLVKVLQMFPSGHPSIDPSTESFVSVLSRFHKDNEQVTISVMGDSVMVNDVSIDKKTTDIRNFIRSFTERKMSSLTFAPETSAEDVKTFARLFNRPPSYISEHGGMGRLVELRDLSSISINRFHYQLISGDGDTDQSLSRSDVTVEDAIFSELIDRLERGDSIDNLPGNKIGDALKSVLAAAREDREEQRGMIARFVTALDPTLLERGLLSNPAIQKGMAWKAVRRMIDSLLNSLSSPDPDVRHEALGKLKDMAMLAVERGKENSTIQIVERVTLLMKREQDPDALYRGVILVSSLVEVLLARGMISIALEAGRTLHNLQSMKFPRLELEAARKRALSEARRRLDTIDGAEVLVQKLLSEDVSVAGEAQRLAMILPPDNLVSQLMHVFHEDNRRLRSKAFQALLRLGRRGLTSIHGKLKEVVTGFDPNLDEASGSLPDSDWFLARNMIQILREIGSPDSESVLADLCRVSDSRIRRECLLALVKVSLTTAESLSLQLVLDRSKDVAEIALDIITKQASNNPAFVPRIIEAFRRNTSIRREILESLSILGKHRQVIEFLSECLEKGPSGILFDDPEMLAETFRIMRRYGTDTELPVLENLRDEVEGGLFKKSKIDRELVSQLKETIEALKLSTSVIESGDSGKPGNERKRQKRRADELKYPSGDDEITILGPDFQGRT
ncbi:MAG: HEAT repeat domain-containing protein [Candidatus Aegiribacteria sp.]